MSKLATTLAEVSLEKVRKTPKTPCFPLYGYGDAEDAVAVDNLRAAGAEWLEVQRHVDKALQIEEPIELGKFIRHWRQQCSCWVA